MAKKHVVQYYDEIQSQLKELINDTKEFDNALRDGYVTQEKYNDAKKTISKLAENYERISYIMMLLNQPQRKSKLKKYKEEHRNEYELFRGNDIDAIRLENKNVIKEFKEFMDNFKEELKEIKQDEHN